MSEEWKSEDIWRKIREMAEEIAAQTQENMSRPSPFRDWYYEVDPASGWCWIGPRGDESLRVPFQSARDGYCPPFYGIPLTRAPFCDCGDENCDGGLTVHD